MIRAQDLSKYFGSKRALGPVSFEIADGESVGFLGLNGAGKTTALRIFACDLRPSSGTVAVGDIDAVRTPHEVRKRIGFLPENPPVYTDMQVEDYLSFAGRIRGMGASKIKRRLPEVLEVTALGEVRGELIGTLSHGFRQRVGVAQAIMHEPQLLILDEPTRGLDPVQIVEMRSMIQDLKESHTVLISSHLLTEIEKTCDRLLVLGEGRIIARGAEDELRRHLVESPDLVIAVRTGTGDHPYRGDERSKIADQIEKVEGVSGVKATEGEEDALTFQVISSRDVRAEVCRALVEGGYDVVKLDRAVGELEDIFLTLVKGGSDEGN